MIYLAQEASYRFLFSADAVAQGARIDFKQGSAIVLHLKLRKVSSNVLMLIANDWRAESGGIGKWGSEVVLPLSGAVPPLEVLLIRQEGRIDLEVPGFGRIGFPRLSTLSAASPPDFPADVISSLPVDNEDVYLHRATFLFRKEAVLRGQSVNYHQGDDVLLHLNLRRDLELGSGQLVLVLNNCERGQWGQERRMGVSIGAGREDVEIGLFESASRKGLVARGPDGRLLDFGRAVTLDGIEPSELPSEIRLLRNPMAGY